MATAYFVPALLKKRRLTYPESWLDREVGKAATASALRPRPMYVSRLSRN
jgi:hypothetical protein